MRQLLSFLIDPVPILYILTGISLLFCLLKKALITKVFIIITSIWFFIITTPFIPDFFLKSLENQYSQISDSTIRKLNGKCNIIVLGGGHCENKDLTANSQLSTQAVSRLVEGIRIHRLMKNSRLILSGSAGRSSISQASLLYKTAIILGIDSTTIFQQTKPSNTQEEAEEYSRIFGKQPVIVVTSASHMPRAMMHFRNTGGTPIASSTDFIANRGSHKNPLWWIPGSDNIKKMRIVLHEYMGTIWYKLYNRN